MQPFELPDIKGNSSFKPDLFVSKNVTHEKLKKSRISGYKKLLFFFSRVFKI